MEVPSISLHFSTLPLSSPRRPTKKRKPFLSLNYRKLPSMKMIPWGGVSCCLSAATIYLLWGSSGRDAKILKPVPQELAELLGSKIFSRVGCETPVTNCEFSGANLGKWASRWYNYACGGLTFLGACLIFKHALRSIHIGKKTTQYYW